MHYGHIGGKNSQKTLLMDLISQQGRPPINSRYDKQLCGVLEGYKCYRTYEKVEGKVKGNLER